MKKSWSKGGWRLTVWTTLPEGKQRGDLCKDIVRLADILGHSSIDTTRIYTIKNSRSELQRLEALGLFVQSTT